MLLSKNLVIIKEVAIVTLVIAKQSNGVKRNSDRNILQAFAFPKDNFDAKMYIL